MERQRVRASRRVRCAIDLNTGDKAHLIVRQPGTDKELAKLARTMIYLTKKHPKMTAPAAQAWVACQHLIEDVEQVIECDGGDEVDAGKPGWKTTLYRHFVPELSAIFERFAFSAPTPASEATAEVPDQEETVPDEQIVSGFEPASSRCEPAATAAPRLTTGEMEWPESVATATYGSHRD